MKERPILFSGEMVRAILAGRKTVTRRVIKPQPAAWASNPAFWIWRGDEPKTESMVIDGCPYGAPGDRLWVRETWAAPHDCDHLKPSEIQQGTRIHFRATWGGPSGLMWRPSIFLMPWMARTRLEVTDVRVERLRDIAAADIEAEGIERHPDGGWGPTNEPYPGFAFRNLWDSINGERAPWASNPFVWVVEFRKLESGKAAA